MRVARLTDEGGEEERDLRGGEDDSTHFKHDLLSLRVILCSGSNSTTLRWK